LLALVLVGCSQEPTGGAQDSVTVTVPPGATLGAAVDSLEAHGVVEHTTLFTWYARLRGLGSSLKSGEYRFHRDQSWGRIVRALKTGRGVEVRFVVPEGLMVKEIAELAQSQLRIPRDSFLAAARLHEGFLYPTTYIVPARIKARDLVELMLATFEDHWAPHWDAQLAVLGMTRREIVTLASIIEGEVRYAPDRRYVSGVYHNRLRRRMALQADPTVIYALGRRRRLWERDYRIRSPYNTYLYAGLPPGPVGQPSRESIEAALDPASVPYLYFVAQADGKHVFSRTYAEHLAAIRRIRTPPARR
jgi:peptidoglycan lytic transglycosylase G